MAPSATTPAISDSDADGSGTGITTKLVSALPVTSPEEVRSDTVLMSKLSTSSAGSVGRASLVKIDRDEKSLKSA